LLSVNTLLDECPRDQYLALQDRQLRLRAGGEVNLKFAGSVITMNNE
jgi:hypothetical protein